MNKIKAIIFDLDGVLIDAKKIHFDALNEALNSFDKKYVISWDEHLLKYDGLKTKEKLNLLTKNKKLPFELHEQIFNLKQQITHKLLSGITPCPMLCDTISKLSENGFKIACCTNSIRKTVLTALGKLNIVEYFNLILSNEDIKNSKPHPEIYWKAMSIFGLLPDETLIIEDSPHGLLAAGHSKSYVMRVKSPSEITYNNIMQQINSVENNNTNFIPKWQDKTLNVLIPMAGSGSRFQQAGYTFPKPLIEVNSKPMIQVVIESLNIDANFIYIVQKEHNKKYNLNTLLNMLTPGCTIVETDGLTEGAACTTLLAKEIINNSSPLLIANSDQYVEWNSNEFMYKMNETNSDGGILTFKSTHPKWSFVKVDTNNRVTEVAEKNPISNNATVGIYYWKYGQDYVSYAEQMITKNLRVNNEFYICPVYNEAIQDNKNITIFEIDKMWGLGTPEDLNSYLHYTNVNNIS